MASVTPPSDEAAELLQKLSLNSQTQTPTFQVSNPSRKYAPVKSSVPTGLNHPFERSINLVLQDFMDSNMFYDPNRYPSSTYYYGGYGGSINEWDKYTQYVNPDGVQVPPHGYGYPTYGMYSQSASQMRHDGQPNETQHFQCHPPYPPSTAASGHYSLVQANISQQS